MGVPSPLRSSTRGLLGRLSEKLVLAANLPPSTTSCDTNLRPLVSVWGQGQNKLGCPEVVPLSEFLRAQQDRSGQKPCCPRAPPSP